MAEQYKTHNMKTSLREYYPNGLTKHNIDFHPNGCKKYERFFNEKGFYHRINAPAYQQWFDNGRKYYEGYLINGQRNNICGPCRFWYSRIDGKITEKAYYINDNYFIKLNWANQIKKI
jgi:antitoxin component YwqK of YwqJK toxin-antitoxin module